MKPDIQRPLFWGLTLAVNPDAHVLILDDKFDERRETFDRICGGAHISWATNMSEVEPAFDQHGSFDVYFLDYNLGESKGGWTAAAKIIRQRDPYSIAKPIILHSTNNADAHEAYSQYFPAAIAIQWDVLCNLMGIINIDRALLEQILAEAGPDAQADKLREISIKFTES